jgi:aryl-alcohol dehydrogenase
MRSPPPWCTSARARSSSSSSISAIRADELLVEVVASGMCATDLHGRAYTQPSFQRYLAMKGRRRTRGRQRGYEIQARRSCGDGLSVVRRVPKLQDATAKLLPARLDLKMNGTRADGSTLHSKDGKPVYSAFFQQSSFGNCTIANERFAVKVRNDAPVESVCALPAADRLELALY